MLIVCSSGPFWGPENIEFYRVTVRTGNLAKFAWSSYTYIFNDIVVFLDVVIRYLLTRDIEFKNIHWLVYIIHFSILASFSFCTLLLTSSPFVCGRVWGEKMSTLSIFFSQTLNELHLLLLKKLLSWFQTSSFKLTLEQH